MNMPCITHLGGRWDINRFFLTLHKDSTQSCWNVAKSCNVCLTPGTTVRILALWLLFNFSIINGPQVPQADHTDHQFLETFSCCSLCVWPCWLFAGHTYVHLQPMLLALRLTGESIWSQGPLVALTPGQKRRSDIQGWDSNFMDCCKVSKLLTFSGVPVIALNQWFVVVSLSKSGPWPYWGLPRGTKMVSANCNENSRKKWNWIIIMCIIIKYNIKLQQNGNLICHPIFLIVCQSKHHSSWHKLLVLTWYSLRLPWSCPAPEIELASFLANI